MSTEAGLLHAITANRADDTARLVYADWLDENSEPDRAAYLRLQVELVQKWWYDNPCTDLYARIADLASRIDSGWLATVRRCTTPAPPVNVEEALPELRGKAKTTVRLHPRLGEAPIDASKIGGMFLWPKREPWPVCPIHDNIPYVTALQLRKEDIPELGFPHDTDLFQLLWCPEQHDEDNMFCPKPAVYWRKRAAMTQPLVAAPDPVEVDFGQFPRPCVLHPERIIEYPDSCELSNSWERDENPLLRAALKVVESLKVGNNWHRPPNGSHLYQTWLSAAGGVKVGGYPDWVQDQCYPVCGCGLQMEHLLSFASWEINGVTWGRWLPIEDRPTLHANYNERRTVHSALNCTFGDDGNMYVFVCRNHREPHIRASMQCG